MLRDEGLTGRLGALWTPTSIMRLIRSEVYIGTGYHMRQMSKYSDDGIKDMRQMIWREKKDWIEIPYPPVIDQETWRKAQEIRMRNFRIMRPRGYKIKGLLRLILWCEQCACRYTVAGTKIKPYKKKDGTISDPPVKWSRWYTCSTGRYRQNPCPNPYLGARKLENSIWDSILSLIEKPDELINIMDRRRTQFEQNGTTTEMTRLQNLMDDIETERGRALSLFQKGYIDEDELDLRMKSILERSEMYVNDLERIKSEAENFEQRLRVLKDFTMIANRLSDRIDNINESEKQEIIHALVDRIVVREDDIKIELAVNRLSVTSHRLNTRRSATASNAEDASVSTVIEDQTARYRSEQTPCRCLRTRPA